MRFFLQFLLTSTEKKIQEEKIAFYVNDDNGDIYIITLKGWIST